jgi:hypothetical protein
VRENSSQRDAKRVSKLERNGGTAVIFILKVNVLVSEHYTRQFKLEFKKAILEEDKKGSSETPVG